MRRWWRSPARREVDRLDARVQSFLDELRRLRHDNEVLRIELALVKQARDHAAHETTYWRERCERFLDQIAVRSGMISAPAMEQPPMASPSEFGNVLAALGHTELPSRDTFAPGAATTAPATLREVDPTAATAAVAAVLDRVPA